VGYVDLRQVEAEPRKTNSKLEMALTQDGETVKIDPRSQPEHQGLKSLRPSTTGETSGTEAKAVADNWQKEGPVLFSPISFHRCSIQSPLLMAAIPTYLVLLFLLSRSGGGYYFCPIFFPPHRERSDHYRQTTIALE